MPPGYRAGAGLITVERMRYLDLDRHSSFLWGETDFLRRRLRKVDLMTAQRGSAIYECKVLPGVTRLIRDGLLLTVLERENELGAVISTAASVTHCIAEDKISDRVERIGRSKHHMRTEQGKICDEIVNFGFFEHPPGNFLAA